MSQKLNMKVQILSRKLIKPANPTPPALRSSKLSSLDQINPPIYTTRILYYHASGDHENGDHRRKLLEESLSEILTLYYPLAGRYVEDSQLIDCNDEGVEYLNAQVSGQLAQILDGEIKPEMLDNLVQYRGISDSPTTPSLIFVQVNMFDCGGLAIGLSALHKIVDGFTASAITSAWATTCSVGGINDVIRTPIFDLASFFPPRENIHAAVLRGPVRRSNTTRRFVFRGETIATLKTIAEGGASCDSTTKRQPSRVVAVTALIWKALIGVSQARHGHRRTSILCHSVDLRRKTSLPIPDNICGNLYMKAFARFGGDSESKLELHELASLVNDAIQNAVADCMKANNGDDLFSIVTNSVGEVSEEAERGETDVFSFASWCRFPLYEVNFGWGKPAWASSVRTTLEVVQMLDTKDGDGIEAWVNLDEKNMVLFQNHPDIMAFASQI